MGMNHARTTILLYSAPLELPAGFEPASLAWKAKPSPRRMAANCYFGAPTRNRTKFSELQIPRIATYALGALKLVLLVGPDPTTFPLSRECSSN